MRVFLLLTTLSVCGFLTTPAFSQEQLITDEEMAMTFNKISQHAARLEPMLEQLHPNDWIAKGAADAYVGQWNSVREQYRAVQTDMSALGQHPGQLSETMKALFRAQSIHPMLDSLMAATRRYQNPALADIIEAVAAEPIADLERVEHYALQIAGEKEQQFEVVDKEAQRCRATLSRQPADSSRTNRKPQ